MSRPESATIHSAIASALAAAPSWETDALGRAAAIMNTLTPMNASAERPHRRDLHSELWSALERRDASAAADALAIGLAADVLGASGNTIRFGDELRRRGILRVGGPQHTTEVIVIIARHVRSVRDVLRLSDREAGYLESVVVLAGLAEFAYALEGEFIKYLQSAPHTTLRGLLVTIDMEFMLPVYEGSAQGERPIQRQAPEEGNSGEPLGGHSRPTLMHRAVDGTTVEELAEAFSYLAWLYDTHVTPRASAVGLSHATRFIPTMAQCDTTKVSSGEYRGILLWATLARRVRAWAVLVDTLGYTARVNPATECVHIAPPEPRIEQVIRLGYITIAQQAVLAGRRAQAMPAASLIQIGDQLYDRLRSQIATYESEPEPRFVYKMPRDLLGALLQTRGWFQEELGWRTEMEKQHLIPADKLIAFEIAPGITVWDLMVVQRVFLVLSRVVARHLSDAKSRGELDDRTLIYSLLPRFAPAIILSVLSAAIGDGKAAAALTLLTWSPQSDVRFDLQTQPILADAGELVIPTNVFALSNLVRNVMVHRAWRPSSVQESDPMEELLMLAFRAKGIPAEHGIRFTVGSDSGDVDVIAVLGEIAFVFECKNPYAPTNPFELRNTLDHAVKGAAQLERVRRLWKDPRFQATLTGRWGTTVGAATSLVTCLILNNRVLTGASIGGQLIGSFHELRNALERGAIDVHTHDDDGEPIVHTRRLWVGDKPTGPELRAFVEGASVSSELLSAMVAAPERYQYGNVCVEVETYALDADAAYDAWTSATLDAPTAA